MVGGLLTQTLVVRTIRTPKLPFIQSRAAWPLRAMTVLVMAAGVFLSMGPLAGDVKPQALPLPCVGCWVAILPGCAALIAVLKCCHIRRLGW